MERATRHYCKAGLVLAGQVITNHDELSRMQTGAELAAVVVLGVTGCCRGFR